MKGKDVNFKEMARLVDDWREAKVRLDVASTELGKLMLPPKPPEFRSQKQFDEYMKLIEEYDQKFSALDRRIHDAQETVSTIEYSVRELIGLIPDTWFVVECKDKAEYGIFVKHNFDELSTVVIKSWEKKHPVKKG